jgi:hypothetical protein
MTDLKILEIAEQHLELLCYKENTDGSIKRPTDFAATAEQIINFARAMYEEGYDAGCFQATGGQ